MSKPTFGFNVTDSPIELADGVQVGGRDFARIEHPHSDAVRVHVTAGRLVLHSDVADSEDLHPDLRRLVKAAAAEEQAEEPEPAEHEHASKARSRR